MANPRKFSEKIALHNQKQAEETAAFEAIIKEVTSATRGPVSAYPKHLPISQNLGAYRGGSLPNVNQIGAGPGIDLQTALQHLDDMKHGRPNLVDRIHRERARQLGPHRRAFPMDKRADCSPYGSTYLSPPPDTSWRRTNSDSALHTSAMTPTIDHVNAPTTPPSHRRIAEVVGENSLGGDNLQLKGYWDQKKLGQSRPKSCEVPNINIYPSQEQEGIHIPISNNTGSLPDLTVLHFPSPLVTPLDVDQDQSYPQGSPVNLSPTSPHHMNMPLPQHAQNQQSPVQRRRHAQGVPSPLVLGNANQMRIPLSPPVSNTDPSKLTVDPRIRQQYMLYMQQQRQQAPTQPQSHHPQTTHPVFNNHQSPQATQQQQHTRHQVPQVHVTSCDHEQEQSQPSMTQYRNSVSDTGCQSPTSPLSQPSYSPAQSPGLPPSSLSSSPFAEAYYLQQQQQTNALQHQFEQFNMVGQQFEQINMLQDNPPNSTMESGMTVNNVSSAIYSNPQPTLNFSQAGMHGLASSQDFQQQQFFHSLDIGLQQGQVMSGTPNSPHHTHGAHNQHSHSQQHVSPTANNKIPDIVLTGADDTLGRPPPDFAKDLGNAITGMPDGFDTDFFSTDEAFKAGLDPLDLDGLQMLTDPNIVTDPATEDTFKLDRL